MSGFFMLAGTVQSELGLSELRQLLQRQSIAAVIVDDELEIEGHANLTFRSGFDHEYILVGDSLDEDTLMAETNRLSKALSMQGISHAIEIYDRQNHLIFEDQYQF
jgi:hypothetical protein